MQRRLPLGCRGSANGIDPSDVDADICQQVGRQLRFESLVVLKDILR
ncbi:MAG: hypothetical protein ACMVO3_01320 [Thalassobaculum sp.]